MQFTQLSRTACRISELAVEFCVLYYTKGTVKIICTVCTYALEGLSFSKAATIYYIYYAHERDSFYGTFYHTIPLNITPYDSLHLQDPTPGQFTLPEKELERA